MKRMMTVCWGNWGTVSHIRISSRCRESQVTRALLHTHWTSYR